MPTTTRLQLPYPLLSEPADVPIDMQELATTLDPKTAIFLQGTKAARPAAGIPGRFYYATDTGFVSYDNGTTWSEVISTDVIPVLTQAPVLDVGLSGQIRAGRQLALADFTALGLSAPLGLWNLSDLTDASGNGRSLLNKGGVPFGVGINGVAGTSAVFAGSTGQALYIADTGAADPFRIKTGSWGCWFRTAKRGTSQVLISKMSAAAGNYSWQIYLASTTNQAVVFATSDGINGFGPSGVSDVCDDRWHHTVATCDGTSARVYVDGVLEGASNGGLIFGGSAPLNIGGSAADAGAAAASPHYGRVDEAFVTNDILSEDQIRGLYCAKTAHGFAGTPTRVTLNVRRRRRGGAFAVADFPTQPVRLHNFTAGSLADQGSGGVALINNGGALSVAGADGAPGGAFSFAGAQSLSATDAGLPAGTAARSYGCWLKGGATGANRGIIGWGNVNDAQLWINASGSIASSSGADQVGLVFVSDGQWHFVIEVDDNAAGDGVRRKIYLDGHLVGGSTVLNAITLMGANRFRIGAFSDGVSPHTGQIDGAFICAYALTFEQVAALYAKGSQALAASPKNEGDHIESFDATNVYATFDTLDSTAQVDLGVAA